MIKLHADSVKGGSEARPRFKLRLMSTTERPKMPLMNGAAISKGTVWGNKDKMMSGRKHVARVIKPAVYPIMHTVFSARPSLGTDAYQWQNNPADKLNVQNDESQLDLNDNYLLPITGAIIFLLLLVTGIYIISSKSNLCMPLSTDIN